MSHPILALTWESWRRSRNAVLLVSLVGLGLPALLYAALGAIGPIDPEEPALVLLQLMLTHVNVVLILMAAVEGCRFEARRLALPVSSPLLIAGTLLPAMGFAAVWTAVVSLALNRWFEVEWSVWGSASVAAAAVAGGLAAQWWFRAGFWQLAAGIGWLCVLAAWHRSRFGPWGAMPTHVWREVTAVELATLMALGVVAVVAATRGLQRTRRGAALSTPRLASWLRAVVAAMRVPGFGERHYSSARQALLTREFRRKGLVLPACTFLAVIFVLSGWLFGAYDRRELLEGLASLGGLLACGGMLGAWLGNLGTRNGNLRMGSFLATHPVSDRLLASTTLVTSLVSLIGAWCLWAIPLGLIWSAAPAAERPFQVAGLSWLLVGVLVGAWVVMSVFVALIASGRSRWVAMVVYAGVCLELLAMGLSHVAGWESWVVGTQAVVLGGGGVGITWVAHLAAAQRGLTRRREAAAALVAWVGLWAIAMGSLPAALPLSAWVVGVALAGLLALAIAPWATVPLAVSHNRHQ